MNEETNSINNTITQGSVLSSTLFNQILYDLNSYTPPGTNVSIYTDTNLGQTVKQK